MLPIKPFVGENPFFFEGAAGMLEAVLTIPPEARYDYVAILGHPHSLQGGTMNNKVVTTMVRAFKELGIPVLRFNFRGVGASLGDYDAGIGESDDMRVLAQLWEANYPQSRFLFAGFSFGSFVAYRAAALHKHDWLLTIAPAVHHYNYQELSIVPTPWHIIQGDDDEVVPLQMVVDFAARMTPALPVSRFRETGHFFHGKLLLLKAEILRLMNDKVLCL